MNAHKVFKQADRAAIELRIGEIEQTTNAEIVCAVATESARYDRAESVVGLFVGIVFLAATNLMNSSFSESGDWSNAGLGLFFQIAAIVVGFVAGNYLAAFCFPIRRAFVSQTRLENETKKAAAFIFDCHEIGEANSRCGVLVYLSLFERRIVIRTDQRCQAVLEETDMQEICESTIELLESSQFRTALLQVIDQIAPLFAKAMPADRILNSNELPDHVLVFHRSP